MLVTALSPVIGYDRAAEIAHRASHTGSTLREAALSLGYVSAAEFDRIIDPASMVGDLPPVPPSRRVSDGQAAWLRRRRTRCSRWLRICGRSAWQRATRC